jgi:ABC-type nickel/cobalt efflux system permease component RcnA
MALTETQQVLAMGYITVHKKGSGISLHFAGELVIFAVLSALLLIITGGTWIWLEWRRRRRENLLMRLNSAEPQAGNSSYADKDLMP